ncbi:cytochrome P450 [Macrolepiota fuliginosa MF-IS2]|uniref:Cytochrome P450 n=1 Tax=Macrolepiota fuliginosa MF-IS2 TaxID=1400762 RepID=A0A9P5XQ75_9AGAR|nr:cytochrome P450 [Macrolepiota fuliginosa MF-IS2]
MIEATTWLHGLTLSLSKLASVVATLAILRVLLWLFNILVLLPPFDPLKSLPGPDGGYFQSYINEAMNPNVSPDTHESWVKEHGRTFRFNGFGKFDYRLLSFDFRIVSHVLTSPTYEKPWQTRSFLSRLIGRGIFSMEGQVHKIQRKIISPAFSSQALKHMTPVMYQKAQELRERWLKILSSSATSRSTTEPEKTGDTIIDVSHWISRASFDVIGLAGFNYNFHALGEESEPVYMAYRRMFAIADRGLNFRGLLDLYAPWLRILWPGRDNTVIDESLKIIDRAGRKLVANKKAEITNENCCAQEKSDKDLLSLLMKSNMSSDPSKRLTDQELLEQCSTFLLAGSDSTSVAISWALHFLSLDAAIQDRLREELNSLSVSIDKANDGPPSSRFPVTSLPNTRPMFSAYSLEEDWDRLDSLPFLDAVVRETLRFSPPVHSTIRVAMKDDYIPISHPIKLQDGTLLQKGDHVAIRKGSYIHIPIEGLNYSEELWGSDVRTFNPDRWFNLPPQVRPPAHPGIGNLMTFSFGPHACLGNKFSTTEMKIFLATLLTNFIFAPAPDTEIQKGNSILTRPFIKDKWELGTQLPLTVHKIHSDN